MPLKFQPSAKFTELEKAILESVANVLSAQAKQLFSEQISLINKTQRPSHAKEVQMYIKGGWWLGAASPFPENVKFNCPLIEFQLARVLLVNEESKFRTKAHLWIVEGHLFSIEFAQSPRALESHFQITGVELLQDPLALEAAAGSIDIDGKLPDDYLRLLEAKEFTINNWRIFSLSEIRTVVDDGPNFYLLAEKEDTGALAIRSGEDTGNLYFCDYNSDDTKVLTNCLRDCCEAI